MRFTYCLVFGVALLLGNGLAENAFAQCALDAAESRGAFAGTSAPSVELKVEKISLAERTLDHLRLALSLALTSHSDVVIRHITFDRSRVNGIPFYVAPVDEPLQLKKGKVSELPRPLELTAYYRDLDSLEPLIALGQRSSAHVEGNLYLDVQLGALQKLFLFAGQAYVPVSFAVDVPVEIPGGLTAKNAAIRGLEAADVALQLAKRGAQSVLNRSSTWRGELSRDYAPSMLLAQSRFAMNDTHDDRAVFTCTGLGFRLSNRRFVLLKSLVEPWKFDPEMASAIKEDHFKVDLSSYDLSVWQADQLADNSASQVAPAARQGQGQVRIVTEPDDVEQIVLVPHGTGHPRKVPIHVQNSAANLVILEFTGSVAGGGLAVAPGDSIEEQSSWELLAAYRFPGGIERRPAYPDLIFTAATKENDRLRLGSPVDSSAWGSPLISRKGIIGVIQTENSGLAWPDAIRNLSGSSPE